MAADFFLGRCGGCVRAGRYGYNYLNRWVLLPVVGNLDIIRETKMTHSSWYHIHSRKERREEAVPCMVVMVDSGWWSIDEKHRRKSIQMVLSSLTF